jgi:uncharacterized protein (DUF427 family)
MRVRFGGIWIADSEDVILLFEPGHYPMAYFPKSDVSADTLELTEYTTQHHELGLTRGTSFERVRKARREERGSMSTCRTTRANYRDVWPSLGPPWTPSTKKTNESWAMAADSYHRIDIRQTSRQIVVQHRDRIIADTKRPLALYESGFAPRWYVPRADVDESALTARGTADLLSLQRIV